MNIKERIMPELGKIVIKVDTVSVVSDTGLSIPKTARADSKYGTVVSSRPEDNIEEGTRVLFHSNSGVNITVDEDVYTVMLITELFARIKEN